ncbi:unnamed protein product, partial [Phaeothamnion confervicola]
LYGLVARGKNVLCEYTASSGNFPTITRVLLGKIPALDGKMSYAYGEEGYVFHYLVEEGITYLCMADEDARRRVPFAFLDDVKNRFRATYGDKAHNCVAFAMADFARTLARVMKQYNEADADKLKDVARRVDDVKGVMVQNIEMVLERGEKLELLVDKSDQLQQQAFKFEKSSRQLKNHLYWQRVKLYAIYAGVSLLLVYALAAMVCGMKLNSC